jgi:hypothetical protein
MRLQVDRAFDNPQTRRHLHAVCLRVVGSGKAGIAEQQPD